MDVSAMCWLQPSLCWRWLCAWPPIIDQIRILITAFAIIIMVCIISLVIHFGLFYIRLCCIHLICFMGLARIWFWLWRSSAFILIKCLSFSLFMLRRVHSLNMMGVRALAITLYDWLPRSYSSHSRWVLSNRTPFKGPMMLMCKRSNAIDWWQ